jgi:hypothetical protein
MRGPLDMRLSSAEACVNQHEPCIFLSIVVKGVMVKECRDESFTTNIISGAEELVTCISMEIAREKPPRTFIP